MRTVVQSTSFKDMETSSKLDLSEVFRKAYSSDGGAKSDQTAQNLKQALDSLVAANTAALEPEVVRGASLTDNVELLMQVDQTPSAPQRFKEELQKEQYHKYVAMMGQLDQCEKLVGPWDPLNNFGNLYEAMVIVHEQIDDFIASTEEQKTAPTPKAGDQLPPQTPSRRNANSLANKAKMLNSQLLDL